jgi:hypothetical protein
VIADTEQPRGDNKLVLFRVQQEGAPGESSHPVDLITLFL